METRPLAAAAAILGAMAILGLMDNLVVVIATDAGLWQFHILRSLMALPVIALGAAAFGLRVAPRRLSRVALRSALFSSAMMIYFACLAFLPVAEVAAGLFTAPIFVLLISVAALGQRIGPVRIAAALTGFAGVVLVLRPDAGGITLLSAAPVLAGLLYALSNLATRYWTEGESALCLLAATYVALAGWSVLGLALVVAIGPEVPAGPDGFLLRGWVAPGGPFLVLTAVQAAGSLAAVWLLIRGYQIGDTSFVSVFEFSLLVFISAWAYALRGETLDVWAGLGIAMIIGAGVAIVLRGR